MGRLKDASEYYLYCAKEEGGMNKLRESMAEDLPTLLKNGADPNIMNFILDKVAYDVSEA